MINNYNIKITKRECLENYNNEMCSFREYLVHGKIYNADNTRYRKFRFIINYEPNDICDFFEIDRYTKQHEKDYQDELIFSITNYINDYNDTTAFYSVCNDTINEHNERNRRRY